MIELLSSIFGGSSFKSVESIAKEWIDTTEEKAAAKAIMVKTLDPNGMMRRQISRTVSNLYVLYIFIMMLLVIMQAFGVGNTTGVSMAINSLKDLFEPITYSFTAIVGASFGVNGINSYKEK